MAIDVTSVVLGEVILAHGSISGEKLNALDELLRQQGFERIDDKKGALLEQMKTLIISTIHHREQFDLTINWSTFLSDELSYDYSYLSTLFSSVSGMTLEQYIIHQKIEKVKEHLLYDEWSVKEIAFKLGYSSVAHLSSQFKKNTGMTPTEFRSSDPVKSRKFLDDII